MTAPGYTHVAIRTAAPADPCLFCEATLDREQDELVAVFEVALISAMQAGGMALCDPHYNDLWTVMERSEEAS